MKLIIDIQDFVYNHIKEFNSTQLYELNVITAIKNGTPLEEELENIKVEVKEHIIFRDKLGMDFVCEPIVEEIIDNYISELKGEAE